MLHISYRKPSKNPKNKLEDLHLYQEYRAISHLLKKFIAKKKEIHHKILISLSLH